MKRLIMGAIFLIIVVVVTFSLNGCLSVESGTKSTSEQKSSNGTFGFEVFNSKGSKLEGIELQLKKDDITKKTDYKDGKYYCSFKTSETGKYSIEVTNYQQVLKRDVSIISPSSIIVSVIQEKNQSGVMEQFLSVNATKITVSMTDTLPTVTNRIIKIKADLALVSTSAMYLALKNDDGTISKEVLIDKTELSIDTSSLSTGKYVIILYKKIGDIKANEKTISDVEIVKDDTGNYIKSGQSEFELVADGSNNPEITDKSKYITLDFYKAGLIDSNFKNYSDYYNIEASVDGLNVEKIDGGMKIYYSKDISSITIKFRVIPLGNTLTVFKRSDTEEVVNTFPVITADTGKIINYNSKLGKILKKYIVTLSPGEKILSSTIINLNNERVYYDNSAKSSVTLTDSTLNIIDSNEEMKLFSFVEINKTIPLSISLNTEPGNLYEKDLNLKTALTSDKNTFIPEKSEDDLIDFNISKLTDQVPYFQITAKGNIRYDQTEKRKVAVMFMTTEGNDNMYYIIKFLNLKELKQDKNTEYNPLNSFYIDKSLIKNKNISENSIYLFITSTDQQRQQIYKIPIDTDIKNINSKELLEDSDIGKLINKKISQNFLNNEELGFTGSNQSSDSKMYKNLDGRIYLQNLTISKLRDMYDKLSEFDSNRKLAVEYRTNNSLIEVFNIEQGKESKSTEDVQIIKNKKFEDQISIQLSDEYKILNRQNDIPVDGFITLYNSISKDTIVNFCLGKDKKINCYRKEKIGYSLENVINDITSSNINFKAFDYEKIYVIPQTKVSILASDLSFTMKMKMCTRYDPKGRLRTNVDNFSDDEFDTTNNVDYSEIKVQDGSSTTAGITSSKMRLTTLNNVKCVSSIGTYGQNFKDDRTVYTITELKKKKIRTNEQIGGQIAGGAIAVAGVYSMFTDSGAINGKLPSTIKQASDNWTKNINNVSKLGGYIGAVGLGVGIMYLSSERWGEVEQTYEEATNYYISDEGRSWISNYYSDDPSWKIISDLSNNYKTGADKAVTEDLIKKFINPTEMNYSVVYDMFIYVPDYVQAGRTESFKINDILPVPEASGADTIKIKVVQKISSLAGDTIYKAKYLGEKFTDSEKLISLNEANGFEKTGSLNTNLEGNRWYKLQVKIEKIGEIRPEKGPTGFQIVVPIYANVSKAEEETKYNYLGSSREINFQNLIFNVDWMINKESIQKLIGR